MKTLIEIGKSDYHPEETVFTIDFDSMTYEDMDNVIDDLKTILEILESNKIKCK